VIKVDGIEIIFILSHFILFGDNSW